MQSHPSTWVTLAHLLRPQGRKGELLVELFSDFPERLAGREDLFLAPPGFQGEQADARPIRILSSWLPHGKNKGRAVLQFDGIESISSAETIAGLDLIVREDNRLPLDEESIYVSDLTGCYLFDDTIPVGEVTEVQFPASANGTRLEDAAPLLVVKGEDQQEILIPFAKALLKQIDLAARKITMSLPVGLVEVNKKSLETVSEPER
ncbi:ribosome maturation factor RimM [Edaphobacter sp. HDX4]|uniref:ribosome maturation factor RimM n=1 Tax=Edaphobacter sp. HDX4 TaxID=2794064 RepID=UPI002FE502B3